jgi:hypothetical protein
MKPIVIAVASLMTFTACATATDAMWTTDRWLRQADKDVTSDRWSFSAVPLGEDGFKLRLTLKTDDLFRPSTASVSPEFDDLRAAATKAAPEGCTLRDLEMQPDGSALADYKCS